jgi:subtilisin-like proprotein convertase family protein
MAASWRNQGRMGLGSDFTAAAQGMSPLVNKLRSRNRSRAATARSLKSIIEALEDRTLFAVAPTPIVTPQPLFFPAATTAGSNRLQYNNPQITYDPLLPSTFVSVSSVFNPKSTTNQKYFVEFMYSIDGGSTWKGPTILTTADDPKLTLAAENVGRRPVVFSQATDPSVGFDRHDNFYITYAEHNDDSSEGQIVLRSYAMNAGTGAPAALVVRSGDNNTTFSGGNSGAAGAGPIYEWTDRDAAYHPTLAVDSNPASFKDPATNAILTDSTIDPNTGQGPLYIAWTQDNQAPDPRTIDDTNFNPNPIKLVASVDGGLNFTTDIYANAGAHVTNLPTNLNPNHGGDRNTTPQMVVSGGSGTVTPGQLVLIWDNFAGGVIKTDFISAGHVNQGFEFSTTNGTAVGAHAVIFAAGPTSPIGAGPAPVASVVGDFNDDTFNDVVTADSGAAQVSFLRNNGNGSFRPLISSPTASAPTAIVAGLFSTVANAKNDQDLIVADATDGLEYLAHRGAGANGTFTSSGALDPLLAGLTFTSITVADFNGDKNLDIAATDYADQKVYILLGKGNGTFNAAGAGISVTDAGGFGPTKVVAADMDGDGVLDLVTLNRNTANAGAAGTVLFLIGDGLGGFVQSGTTINGGAGATTLAVADLDGDGRTDVGVAFGNPANSTSGIRVFKNTTFGGVFKFNAAITQLAPNPPRLPTQPALTVPETPVDMVAANFSGGGIDFAVSDAVNDQVVFYKNITTTPGPNPGPISFASPLNALFDSSFTVGATPTGLAVGDFNGDGKNDLVIANSGDNTDTILLGTAALVQGNAFFTSSISFPNTPGLTLDDLNVELAVNDGTVNDLIGVLTAPTGQSVVLFLNQVNPDGSPVFPPVPADIGIAGEDLGELQNSPTTLAYVVGMTFDDNAPRDINDVGTVNTPYIGHFRPEGGSLNSLLAGQTPASLTGTWYITLIDVDGTDNFDPTLDYAKLILTANTNVVHSGPVSNGAVTDVTVATSSVAGALNAPYPLITAASPVEGVGPGAVIASDNTMGSFSPYKGRLYVAYTGRSTATGNPADNTDIGMAYSDDGGVHWTQYADPTIGGRSINDDNARLDGFSESTPVVGNFSNNGRPQFMPSIAVDQATGSLILSYFDGRYDAARTRVANSVEVSIDGGHSFGPSTYLNAPNSATDGITRSTVNTGPTPDNFASNADTTFSMGAHQGMIAYGGRLFAVWAGNQDGGRTNAQNQSVRSATAIYGGGPRIIRSDFGPVTAAATATDLTNTPVPYNNTVAADGTRQLSGFVVYFDRPIDATTFTAANVSLIFTGPTGIQVDLSSAVTGVMGLFDETSRLTLAQQQQNSGFGPSKFLVQIDPAAIVALLGANQITSTVGTYSYAINPTAAGITISDRIRQIVVGNASTSTTTTFAPDPTQLNLTIPSIADVTNSGTLRSTDTVSNIPLNATATAITVSVDISYPNDANLSLALRAPDGTLVILDDFVATGSNFTATIFDDAALTAIANGVAPYTGSFQPSDPLSTFAGRTGVDLNGDWKLEIINKSTVLGSLNDWSLTITTTAPQRSNAGLGNAMDQAPDAIGGDVSYVVGSGSPQLQSRLPLIIPGPHIVSSHVSDTAATPTAYNASNNIGQSITSAGLTSTVTVPQQSGHAISKVSVTVSLTDTNLADVGLMLVSPLLGSVTLANPGDLAGLNLSSITFDDSGALLSTGSDPYSGTFAPSSALSVLNGSDPSGDWQLVIIDGNVADTGTLTAWRLTLTADNAATSDNLVLNGTVNSIDVTFDRSINSASIFTPSVGDPNTGAALAGVVQRLQGPAGLVDISAVTVTDLNPVFDAVTNPVPNTQFRFTFGGAPLALAGTYTLVLASSITSTGGDQLDSNLNAGVDALRGTATTSVKVSFAAPASAIPNSGAIGSTAPYTSSFTVPGGNLSNPRVTLNISYPNDPDLVVTLSAFDPTTNLTKQVTLFANVGNNGTHANFSNTFFTDGEKDVNGNNLPTPTPVTSGSAPFFGQFAIEDPNKLGFFDSMTTTGDDITWTLSITGNNHGVGKLNAWSLTFDRALPSTGLGDANADVGTASFRIFTEDPSNPLSRTVWTAIGGAGNTGLTTNDHSGRIGGLAVDPSDPSGNTVYVAGASGGVWKTTNFLTSDPAGPTYIPLTDFGATNSISIGGLAVFGVNKDTKQSFVIAGTGEGDTIGFSPNFTQSGVGFIRSTDGGATWTLLDSTTNVDASGNLLPINSPLRDHVFVGTSTYKVVVDPRPTPSGDVIIYAALSDQTGRGKGGIWRSLDSGKHWAQVFAGDATDVTLDLNSGVFNAVSNPTGNLQILYAAMRGQGVFLSPNRGQTWNLMAGSAGDPLIVDRTNSVPTAVVVNNNTNTPNGAKGRIVLAKPALTGNPLEDTQYEGWLYAAVAGVDGKLDGIYMTKDFGQNWVNVRIPGIGTNNGIPSNNISNPDFNILGGNDGFGAQGNYDISLAVSSTDPNIIYVGGTADANPSGFIRVDVTTISDAHNFTVADDRNDGGALTTSTGDPVALKNWLPNPPGAPTLFINPVDSPFLNLLRDPSNPFAANATVNVQNTASFANSGAGVKWIPFDLGFDIGLDHTDQHRIITYTDPGTGQTRIIIGDDQGVWTGIDDGNGYLKTAANGFSDAIYGARNGNLQITQNYAGAVAPSSLAAQVAGALAFSIAQDDGYNHSPADGLTTGNIGDIGETGDGTNVATNSAFDPSSSSTGASANTYLFEWPLTNEIGGTTDFFGVVDNGSGRFLSRTFGLLQQSNAGRIPDPQWPGLSGSYFSVNPIDGDQIIISSQAGRIFGTTNQGKFWSVIGEVPGNGSAFGVDGNYKTALAYGAPDIGSPGGIDPTNFHLYAGSTAGNLYVTFTGGGANGTAWIQLPDASTFNDHSAIQSIVANPQRGTHEIYFTTQKGVYHIADTSVANPVIENITGNLFKINTNPFNTSGATTSIKLGTITTLVADWRYALPDDLANADAPTTHPMIYIAGNGGVFRSVDKGTTWTLFPDDTVDNATAAGSQVGGYLPDAYVSDIDISSGNIDPATGHPDLVNGDPDMLVATFYGRGQYGIRVAPIIYNPVGGLDQTVLFNNANGTISLVGFSETTSFKNATRISVYDSTGTTLLGGFNKADFNTGVGTEIGANETDSAGRFSITITDPATLAAIRAGQSVSFKLQAMDDAGTVGPMLGTTLKLDTIPPVMHASTFGAIEGQPFTGTVATFSDVNLATVTNNPNGTAIIDWGDGFSTPGTLVLDATGGGTLYDVVGTHTYATAGTTGKYTVTVTIVDAANNTASATTIDQALVSDPAVIATAGANIAQIRNQAIPSGTVVATFIDPAGAVTTLNPDGSQPYTALIDWGDGTTPSAGVITEIDPVAGVFSVSVSPTDGHTYTTSDFSNNGAPFTIIVTINHDSAPGAQATLTATITDLPLVIIGGNTLNAAEGSPIPQVGGAGQKIVTFTDPAGAQDVSLYTAAITWGDGSTSAGVVTFDPSSQVFSVTGVHTYATEGTKTVGVVITHGTTGASPVATSTFIVSDPAVVTAGPPVSFSGFVNVALSNQVIATFTDPGGAEAAPNYTATVAWGDGTTSVAGVSLNASTGVFSVSGLHTYTNTGNFTLDITVSHGTAASTVLHAAATITVVPVNAVGGATITGQRGVALPPTTPLATFTDPAGSLPAGSYTATIDWGDNSPQSSGVVTFIAAGNFFTVTGGHTFSVGGNPTVTVTITRGGASAVVTDTATIAESTIIAAGGLTLNEVRGRTNNLQVAATFIDPAGAEANNGINYSATIDWGDGTSSSTAVPPTTGNVQIQFAAGTFAVIGTHAYATTGNHTISIAIFHNKVTADATVTSTAAVVNAPVTATGAATIIVGEGASTGQVTVATFTDGTLPETTSHYGAIIDWGDGTAFSQGVIGFNTITGVFSISSTHIYGVAGSHTITTTISHGNAATVAVTTPVMVVDVPVVVSPGATIATTEGNPTGNIVVATFADPGLPEPTNGHYGASINWGDGTVTSGIVNFVPSTQRFTVTGGHTYVSAGAYAIVTTVTHDTAIAASATTAANVSDAPIDLTMVPVNPIEGTVFNGIVASFIDGNPFAVAGDFSSTINWGDGTSTSGSIIADSNTPGRFNLFGNHTFADGPSVASLAVSVNDSATVGRPSASGSESVSIQNAAPTPTIQGPAFRFGGTTTFTIGAIDPSGADADAGFLYSINWGDGTSQQTIARTPGNGAPVSVPHTYSSNNAFTITVNATDKDGDVGAATFGTVGSAPAGNSTAPVLQNLVINGGSSERSAIHTIGFQIVSASSPVTSLSLSDLTLLRNGNVPVSLAGASFSFDAATGQVTLNTSSLNLADGEYQLQVHLGSAGTLPVGFIKLRGDLNGDGIVNKTDVTIEKNHIGSGDLNFDLNGDGRVNSSDAAIVTAAQGHRTASAVKSVSLMAGAGVTKPSIDFGSIKLAQSATPIDIVLRNSNTSQALRVSDIKLIGKNPAQFDFEVVGAVWGQRSSEYLIPAGQTLILRVYANPHAKGTQAATLNFIFSRNDHSLFNFANLPVTAKVS